jgi:hypothetical protein
VSAEWGSRKTAKVRGVRELAAMYPEKEAAEPKSANSLSAPASTFSTTNPTVNPK